MVVGAGDRSRTGDVQLGNFPFGGLTKYHFPSESITSSRGREPQVSRPMTPSHEIWAPSWAAETGYRVMAETCFIAPLGVSRFTARSWSVGMIAAFDALHYGIRIRSDPAVWTCLAQLPSSYYTLRMKTLTVRLPEALVAEIEAESRQRRRSKSDVVRERLSRVAGPRSRPASPAIDDLVGSVDGLPVDLSGQKKAYLKSTGYGRKRAR
jgi:Ribbon-helix-helix protein, copG family